MLHDINKFLMQSISTTMAMILIDMSYLRFPNSNNVDLTGLSNDSS